MWICSVECNNNFIFTIASTQEHQVYHVTLTTLYHYTFTIEKIGPHSTCTCRSVQRCLLGAVQGRPPSGSTGWLCAAWSGPWRWAVSWGWAIPRWSQLGIHSRCQFAAATKTVQNCHNAHCSVLLWPIQLYITPPDLAHRHYNLLCV